MPITVTCRHCGATYPVADDLGGRTLLCKECDRPVVVEPNHPAGAARKPSPVRWFGRAVVVLLALVPAGLLAALWWTGWLWDLVDWPSADRFALPSRPEFI